MHVTKQSNEKYLEIRDTEEERGVRASEYLIPAEGIPLIVSSRKGSTNRNVADKIRGDVILMDEAGTPDRK